MKKISLLFAMMLVMLTTVSAKAQDLYNGLNGNWTAELSTQEGNMSSTMRWSFSFNSSNGQVTQVVSADTNGIEGFFVFEAGGTYTTDGDQLKFNWDVENAVLNLNPFAEIMFGDQANMAKQGILEEFKNQLKQSDKATISDFTGTSYKFFDPSDGTTLEFVKAN